MAERRLFCMESVGKRSYLRTAVRSAKRYLMPCTDCASAGRVGRSPGREENPVQRALLRDDKGSGRPPTLMRCIRLDLGQLPVV